MLDVHHEQDGADARGDSSDEKGEAELDGADNEGDDADGRANLNLVSA